MIIYIAWHVSVVGPLTKQLTSGPATRACTSITGRDEKLTVQVCPNLSAWW
jgi:hypothetical protein